MRLDGAAVFLCDLCQPLVVVLVALQRLRTKVTAVLTLRRSAAAAPLRGRA
jgi:hypothetical protein